jgi:Protein of unknown function (DUF2950)/Protein of unknown function (DUF3300)
MSRVYRTMLLSLFSALVLLAWSSPAMAQDSPQAALFKPEELEQLVAPIALYPDALLAQVLMVSTYLANWGNSGVMIFMVNHDGVVYQKDLGPETAALARAMTRFNPDST